MRRLLPVILLVTVIPTIILIGAAIYIGQQFDLMNRKTEPYPGFGKENETRQVSNQVSSTQRKEPTANQSNPTKSDASEWTQLFDGKTMKGWEGKAEIFRVEQGSIVGGNLKKKIENNEFLTTNLEYDNFELRLEAKLIGEGKNAGIQFRSQRIPNHHEMIGYQCDMGMMKDRSIWGSLYDESRRRMFLAHGDAKETLAKTKTGQWNEFVIRCEGKRTQIWLNGYRTVDYTEDDPKIPLKGKIGLQIHSGPPAEAWYKSISIKKL